MTSYSLDDLKAGLDQEFKPLEITVGGDSFVLQNLMRLGEKKREAVTTALSRVEEIQPGEGKETSPEEVNELVKAVTEILVLVTADNKGKKLATHLDGDMLLTMKVMELWTEATQPGEAQASHD